MEPLSILGAVAACTELIRVIAKVTANLASLKLRWTEAARPLQLLIGKLSTVRAALTQIKDWADFNLSTSPNGEEMQGNLGVAIEGCQVIIEALDHETTGLLGDSLMSRLKQFFFDSTIKEYERRLVSQITALQLLLTAAYCQNLSEQNSLLQQSAARNVFQRIREDTSTVREQMTVRSTVAMTEIAPASTSRIDDQTGSFSATRTSVDFSLMLEGDPDRGGYGAGTSMTPWQRPAPFEMLPYSPVNPSFISTSLPMDKSSGFHISKTASINKPLSVESQPKPQYSFRQRLGRLKLSISPSNDKLGALVPPKSQLRIRFPGVLAATDMYLKSEDGQPPSSAIAAAQRGDYAEMTTLIRRKVNMQQPDGKTGRTPLAVACHCGHDNIVQLLISKGVNIHSKDKQRLSPLHLAAANGHCKVIETLLDRAANINARGPQEKTPLRIASDHGELDAVRLLVSRRAMIDCRDDEQKTALHAVCRAGDEETAGLLLGSGANKSAKDSKMRTPLHSACISGQVRVAEMLIEAKADLEAQDEKNLTPLAISAKLGLTAVVDLLLRHKASPKTKSAGDLTPLHWASYNGHDEAVVLLMANRKTELDARDINGYSPLHVAAMSRSFGVIENLLGAGAAVEAECHKGNRPLHYACRSASYSVVSLLLNAGADCNAQNDVGQTPLHVTVDSGRDARITKALIARGTTVDAADRTGTRPLAIACLAGHVENTHVLLAQGASVRDMPDAPICLAASGGHVKVIQALLHRGGDVHQTDAQGWDPLRRAAFAGHAEAVACLLRSGARATVLGPLESFTFTSGATLEQCQRVFRLLITANQAEPDDSQRVIHLVSAARNVNAPEAMVELPQTELRGIRSRSNLNLPAEALSLARSVLLTESSRPTAPESQVSIGADDGRGGPMLPSTSAPPLTLKRPDPAATLPSSPPRPIKATPNINLSTSGLEGETPGTVYYELDGREITGTVVV